MIDATTKGVISVWMGTTKKTYEQFCEYTEGLEDSDSKCPAFKDWGTDYIDTDWFIAYITANFEVIPIEELVKEVDTNSRKTADEIVKVAKEKGVCEGNSLYYYIDATFIETEPGKLYNDLRFIGTFDNSYK